MKRLNKTLTIIIPTLNEEKRIPLLLSDLSKQTYKNFHIIIVDASSKNNTLKKVREFKNKLSLSIIKSNQQNVCYQRNLGAKHCSTEWLIFMDADIRIPKNFLKEIMMKTKQINAQIFSTHLSPDKESKYGKIFSTMSNIYFELFKNTKNPAAYESLTGFKTKIFKELKGYNEKTKWSEGRELLKKAAKKNIKLKIYSQPKYVFSLRRLKSQGVINLLTNLSILISSEISQKKLSAKKISSLYPMIGGKNEKSIF